MADITSILKQVIDSSAQLSTWALAVGGGSVLTVVSTSYHRPDKLLARLPYLLFLPAWACLGYSLYLGDRLAGKYLATLMVKADQVAAIASSINDLFDDQRAFLLYSLMFFATWLVVYLVSWILVKTFKKEEDK